ncbi:MAG: NUDIX hydrolase [Pseudomonadota bacterium]
MGQTDARLLTGAPIRDAATTIVLRDAGTRPRVLMGQRGKSAAFMPSKFVFPGGAVDDADANIPLARPCLAETEAALSARSALAPRALVAAATRELWEETGLLLGHPGACPTPVSEGWASYAATGFLPDGAGLSFIFRAVTPPGRPRRFDARFFLVDANAVQSDPDDFGRAEDELSHLQWVPLEAARGFDMPFITEVVLAELAARISGRSSSGVPFFDNSGDESRFCRL